MNISLPIKIQIKNVRKFKETLGILTSIILNETASQKPTDWIILTYERIERIYCDISELIDLLTLESIENDKKNYYADVYGKEKVIKISTPKNIIIISNPPQEFETTKSLNGYLLTLSSFIDISRTNLYDMGGIHRGVPSDINITILNPDDICKEASVKEIEISINKMINELR